MEGNKKNRSRALLIFGAPACGKTTFAEKFAKKFNLAFYDLTELMEKYHFSRGSILVIIEQITKTRQTIILEGCLDTEQDRAEIRNLLRKHGYDPALVWVQTDAATIRQRLKSKYRSVTKARDAYEKAVSEIEAPVDSENPIILSGKHTFDTQVRHVVAGLADLSQ